MTESLTFNIAGIKLNIRGKQIIATLRQISGFAPFLEKEDTEGESYTFLSGCEIESIYNEPDTAPGKHTLLHKFDFEDIDCYFYRTGEDNLYQFEMVKRGTDEPFIIKYLYGNKTIEATTTVSTTELRFGLWMAYGLIASVNNRIAVHSSTIMYERISENGETIRKAVMFLGESGTGKSTHTKLWLENIPGCTLLNDDSPVIQSDAVSGKIIVHGSPWSGKTPCYKKISCEVAAIIRLSQAPYNKLKRLTIYESIGALFPSCPPSLVQDKHLQDHILCIISDILKKVPVYHLECLPDKGAVNTVLNGVKPK